VSARTAVWQRLWRRPAFRRGFYELLGLVLARQRGFEILNCGHHEEGYPDFPLSPETEAERVGFQLYHRIAESATWAGRDVIEFGCGRGGGARFLARSRQPRRYLATDASRLLIRAARRLGAPPPLEFKVTRAESVPEAAGSFDLGLAVEAVSPLGDRAAFLAEAARLLRADGRLLVTDFFYTGDHARNAEARFRAVIDASAFAVEQEYDWTTQAVRALEVDSPRRLATIARLPRLWRRAAIAFAGTTQSPLYRQLRDGRARHLHFVLRRR
jgi:SAM-dependent methyltransferase